MFRILTKHNLDLNAAKNAMRIKTKAMSNVHLFRGATNEFKFAFSQKIEKKSRKKTF